MPQWGAAPAPGARPPAGPGPPPPPRRTPGVWALVRAGELAALAARRSLDARRAKADRLAELGGAKAKELAAENRWRPPFLLLPLPVSLLYTSGAQGCREPVAPAP